MHLIFDVERALETYTVAIAILVHDVPLENFDWSDIVPTLCFRLCGCRLLIALAAELLTVA